jgi:hypothetical protein
MRIPSLEVHPKIYQKNIRKSGFNYWTTKIDSIQNKLKDKNYRGYRKSCLRMENHANGMAHSWA